MLGMTGREEEILWIITVEISDNQQETANRKAAVILSDKMVNEVKGIEAEMASAVKTAEMAMAATGVIRHKQMATKSRP